MKLVRWKRFIWDLTKIPPFEKKLPSHFAFREAARDEGKPIFGMVLTSFTLDSEWSDVLNSFRDRLEMQIDLAFQRESTAAIVVTHGTRVIAASVLSTEIDGESNLVSGPCVLSEYGNRGIGSALLYCSLQQLKKAGLDRAAGITKENVAACKFVYPKFGSASSPHDYEPQLIGT
jgi:predicted GNAT family acetyltransferase